MVLIENSKRFKLLLQNKLKMVLKLKKRKFENKRV